MVCTPIDIDFDYVAPDGLSFEDNRTMLDAAIKSGVSTLVPECIVEHFGIENALEVDTNEVNGRHFNAIGYGDMHCASSRQTELADSDKYEVLLFRNVDRLATDDQRRLELLAKDRRASVPGLNSDALKRITVILTYTDLSKVDISLRRACPSPEWIL